GSGSLTHVLEPIEQERLMRACARLCPDGPILASFFCQDDAVSPPRIGGATKMGLRIGRMIAAMRRLPRQDTESLSYRPHSGFAFTFTPRRVERLATGIGRKVSWEPGTSGGFQCVTFHSSE